MKNDKKKQQMILSLNFFLNIYEQSYNHLYRLV